MLIVAIGFSVVLMCAQGVSALTSTDYNSSPLDSNGTQFDGDSTWFDNNVTLSDVIYINNVTGLNMIGKNISHPFDGYYELTDSFDASDFNESIHTFSGSIQGNGHTLYKIKRCLIKELVGNGIIQNIKFNNANTTNAKCASAVVGVVKDYGIIRFIKVENGLFKGSSTSLGAVAQSMKDFAQMENILVESSEIIGKCLCWHYVDGIGGVLGVMSERSSIKNVTIYDSNIVGYGTYLKVGGVIGRIFGGTQGEHITAINSIVTSDGRWSNTGGVVGRAGHSSKYEVLINGIAAINMNVTSKKDGGSFGGAMGSVEYAKGDGVTVINTFLKSGENEGAANIGGVLGIMYCSTFNNIVCINATLESGSNSSTHVGYMVGSVEHSISHNNLVIGSHIKELSNKEKVGGWAGLGCNSNITNVIYINNTVEVRTNFGISVCVAHASCIYGAGSCTMADSVVFSDAQEVNTTQGIAYLYHYSMENITYKCSCNKLTFITDNCEVDATEFEFYQQLGRWDNFNNYYPIYQIPLTINSTISATISATISSMTVPASVIKEVIIPKEIILAGTLGISGAILVSSCCYQWFVGYREGVRGKYLIMMPVTKVRKMISSGAFGETGALFISSCVCQWCIGYHDGDRVKNLIMKPFTKTLKYFNLGNYLPPDDNNINEEMLEAIELYDDENNEEESLARDYYPFIVESEM